MGDRFTHSNRAPTLTSNAYPSSSLLISTTDGNTSTHDSSHDYNQSTSFYTDLKDQPEETKSNKTVTERPDNPAKAVFYFVMYTLVSTYCLIAGKFFKTWYPENPAGEF